MAPEPEYGSLFEKIVRQGTAASEKRMNVSSNTINTMLKNFRTPINTRGPTGSPVSMNKNQPPVGFNGLPFRREVKDPLKDYTITSPYGMRTNPFTGEQSFHTGIDLAAPQGTPIYASASGRIGKRTGWSDVYGNEIIIRHGGGWKTGYHHLIRDIVKRGQYVKRGQLIGYVGSTGYSTGPHLHWSVYRKGKEINPRRFL